VRKIVISHFYNEEYLLPWWLKHHKNYFDHGIMIDYHSTDSSRKIIYDICPKWDVITSLNPNFEAVAVDQEIMSIESWFKEDTWKITLNTTEFLVSTKEDWNNEAIFKKYSQIRIPCHAMVDTELDKQDLSYDIPLHEQKDKGINVHVKPRFWNIRSSRSMHRINVQYSVGRHFSSYSTDRDLVKAFKDGTTSTNFNILWFGFAPFNEKLLKRKLQIQHVMPKNGFGVQHITNEDKQMEKYKELLQNTGEMSFLKNQEILTF